MPELLRPLALEVGRRHERPVLVANLLVELLTQSRHRDGAAVPTVGCIFARAVELLLVSVCERFTSGLERALTPGRHLPFHLFDQQRQTGLRIRRHIEIDIGRVALREPIVRLWRESHRGDADRLGARLQRRAQLAALGPARHEIERITGLEHQQHVRLTRQRTQPARLVQRMAPWEVESVLTVTDRCLQGFRQLDQQAHTLGGTRRAVGVNHRILRLDEQSGCFLDRALLTRGRRRTNQLRNLRSVSRAARNLIFLHQRIDREQRRSIRWCHRNLVGAYSGLTEVPQRARRIVPLREITHHPGAVGRGVRPGYFANALADIGETPGHHEDGNAIGVRVVNGHGAVLQPYGGVHHASHRLAFDLRVTMRHRHRCLFVHRRDRAQVWGRQHAVVDHGLVDAHESIARRGGEVLDAETSHDVDHIVAAAARVGDALLPCRELLGRSVVPGRTRLLWIRWRRSGGRALCFAGYRCCNRRNPAQGYALEKTPTPNFNPWLSFRHAATLSRCARIANRCGRERERSERVSQGSQHIARLTRLPGENAVRLELVEHAQVVELVRQVVDIHLSGQLS